VVCWQVTLCDPHLSALEVRFSRRCAIQIDVYLYLTHEASEFAPFCLFIIFASPFDLPNEKHRRLALIHLLIYAHRQKFRISYMYKEGIEKVGFSAFWGWVGILSLGYSLTQNTRFARGLLFYRRGRRCVFWVIDLTNKGPPMGASNHRTFLGSKNLFFLVYQMQKNSLN